MGGLSGVTDTENTALFYYEGNTVSGISGISTKAHQMRCCIAATYVQRNRRFRLAHFFYLIGNINLNRRTKNTHKMGMGNFKESAGMLKNTL